MLNKLICHEGMTLLKALEIINTNARGTAFITNDQGKIVGVATDGDIRRMLLEGIQLDEKIGAHVKTEFSYAFEGDSLQDITRKIDERVKIIPIVNQNFVLKDFFEIGSKSFIPVASPSLRGNEFKYLTAALLSTWISSRGEYINRLENEFSNYCGTQYGVAVSNGTVAIHLALVTLGVHSGDEVIVPDLTFAATINAVLHAGATPVIVDIDKETWCIRPEKIEEAITSRTKAIIPVHLYGMPCDMAKIMAISRKNDLYVIEDCAEAHGAEFEGQKVGSFGDISTFSFFANKIITCGEGGICLTNSDILDKRMRKLRDHGMSLEKKYWHDEVGFNYRMTNLQAAIGVAQLEQIDQILNTRDSIKKKYKEIYSDRDDIVFQKKPPYLAKTVTWLVCALLETENRDLFIEKYKEHGIELRPFFYPLSQMDIYRKYAKERCESSIEISKKGINFPTYNDLSEKDFSLVKSIA